MDDIPPMSVDVLTNFWDTVERTLVNESPTTAVHVATLAFAENGLIPEVALRRVAPALPAHLWSELFSDRIETKVASIMSLARLASNDPGVAFLLGYFVSLVAPGLRYLHLIPRQSVDATLWYGFFASLRSPYECLVSVEGLGLRLHRELSKPFSIFTRPSSDISLAELETLGGMKYLHRDGGFSPFSDKAIVGLEPGISSLISIRGGAARPDAAFVAELRRHTERMAMELQGLRSFLGEAAEVDPQLPLLGKGKRRSW